MVNSLHTNAREGIESGFARQCRKIVSLEMSVSGYWGLVV